MVTRKNFSAPKKPSQKAHPAALTAASLLGFLISTHEVDASGATNDANLIEATLVEDIGAAERIEAADVMRTVSQELGAAACFLYNGIDTDESRRIMLRAQERFVTNIEALIYGNPSMNIIGGETRARTIRELESILTEWAPISEASKRLDANPTDSAAVDAIKAGTFRLYDMTNHLVSEISGEYSNPAELLQVDALMLDIAGRQAMLAQIISKNACKIWTRDEQDAARDRLSESMELLDRSLNALRHGMAEVGLKPAPTPEIANALDGVIADWAQTRPELDRLLAENDLPEETRTQIFRRMNDKTSRLEDIVHQYTAFAKHQY